jgi:hypothetical protein
VILRTIRIVIIPACLLVAACQARQADPPAAPAAPPAPPYTTTASIKDIMQHIVDPAGDLVWESVSVVVDTKGVHETIPKTDEDWAKARGGAITLIEASNLLMIPGRHVAKPGEKSEAPGVELEPSEMEALIVKDLPSFYKRAGALHDVATKTLQIIDAKDVKALYEVGEELDKACENCHRQYWYPNEPVQPLTNEPDPKPADPKSAAPKPTDLKPTK